MSRLGDFLRHLGDDPAALDEYRRHPREAMRRAGLADPEVDLVTSGDVPAIRQALGGEQAEQITVIMVMVAKSGGGDDEE
jgi:hypothetical protein